MVLKSSKLDGDKLTFDVEVVGRRTADRDAMYAMPGPSDISPDDRPRGWLVSVQTTERLDRYAVGTGDAGDAHDLVAEYCQAHLSHAVRLERPLTDVEIDRIGLKDNEVKPFV